MKREIRVLGIDDGVFTPHTRGHALVVGVVFRGGYWLDGVMRTNVRVDGFDATRKIASMVLDSPHHKQLRIIMLNGVTFAGFNIVDIKELSLRTGLPVIAVTRDRPNLGEIRDALKNLPRFEERWRVVQNTGEPVETYTKNGQKIYINVSGVSVEDAQKILRITSTRSNIPEALRVAHLVASGIRHS